MDLRSTQGDEERLGLGTTLCGTVALSFVIPTVEMFFDSASWLPAVSANNTQSEAACEQTKRLDRQVQ